MEGDMQRFGQMVSFVAIVIPTLVQADVASGPSVGAEVRPLKVEGVAGDFAGKEVDVAAERGHQPTVYLFVHAQRFDRPAARFMKKLDEAVKSRNGKAAVVAVWLSDDKESARTRLTAIQNSLQFAATSLSVYPSLSELPDGWGLNTDAHLTAVVAAKGKVTANFAYVSVNETVAPEVIEALEKVLKQP
jgi:hypothetical protein